MDGKGVGTAGTERRGSSLHIVSRLVAGILEPVTFTGTDHVQSGLVPIEVDESQIEQRSDDDGGDGE